ncbi:MAG: hypothetical protein J07HX5_01812 [halophilic archaeon J07HX5]|nr:MAG: hypothetical protein J07HX5_01812 [halophilic archaeon J07HX5]
MSIESAVQLTYLRASLAGATVRLITISSSFVPRPIKPLIRLCTVYTRSKSTASAYSYHKLTIRTINEDR